MSQVILKPASATCIIFLSTFFLCWSALHKLKNNNDKNAGAF